LQSFKAKALTGLLSPGANSLSFLPHPSPPSLYLFLSLSFSLPPGMKSCEERKKNDQYEENARHGNSRPEYTADLSFSLLAPIFSRSKFIPFDGGVQHVFQGNFLLFTYSSRYEKRRITLLPFLN